MCIRDSDYTELSYDAAGGAIVAVRWDGGCDVLDARGEVLAQTDYAWLSLLSLIHI